MSAVGVAPRQSTLAARGMRECRRLSRREARTFYIAFRLLPPARCDAICALYAFSREADDAADEPGLSLHDRLRRLDGLRADLDGVFSGRPTTARLAALADTVERYRIERELLETLLDGVTMDLRPRRHQSLDELREYCHAVAGVIGVMCVRIFGTHHREADLLAAELGFALQLTNILRDVDEDGRRGRFYLPLDDLAAAGVDEAAILAHDGTRATAAFGVLALQGERAARAFDAAGALLPMVPRRSRPCLRGIALLYRGYLDRLRDRGFAVTGRRVRLSAAGKLAVAMRALGAELPGAAALRGPRPR